MRTDIIVKHTRDNGIIAELHYLTEDGQILVILSGGNWIYEDEEEAEVNEIWELLFDAQEKGFFVDPRGINVSREFGFE